MKQHSLIFLLLAFGIISVAELFVILTTISPHSATPEVFWTFFVCLFLALTSFLTFIWQAVQSKLLTTKTHVSWVSSLRQCSLLVMVIVLSLFFKSLNILSIWDTLPLAISAILIEFFFQADKSTSLHDPSLRA